MRSVKKQQEFSKLLLKFLFYIVINEGSQHFAV